MLGNIDYFLHPHNNTSYFYTHFLQFEQFYCCHVWFTGVVAFCRNGFCMLFILTYVLEDFVMEKAVCTGKRF